MQLANVRGGHFVFCLWVAGCVDKYLDTGAHLETLSP